MDKSRALYGMLTALAFAFSSMAQPHGPLGVNLLVELGFGPTGITTVAAASLVAALLCLREFSKQPFLLASKFGPPVFAALLAASALPLFALSASNEELTVCLLLIWSICSGALFGHATALLGGVVTRFSPKALCLFVAAFALLFAAAQPLGSFAALWSCAPLAACSGLALSALLTAVAHSQRPHELGGGEAKAESTDGAAATTDHSARSTMTLHFAIFGFGVSFYMGYPALETAQNPALPSAVSPWLASMVGFAAFSCLAALVMYRILIDLNGFRFGLLMRYLTMPLTLFILFVITVLTHNVIWGSFAAALPTAIAIVTTAVSFLQAYQASTHDVARRSLLFLMQACLVGSIAGTLFFGGLWLIEDSLLRLQIASIALVAANLASISRFPKRTSTAQSLLLETYPEDMSEDERWTCACASVAQQWGLSSRECDVLRSIVTGISQKQIATTLGISPRTVQAHVASIYKKLDVHSVSELLAIVRNEVE